MNAYLIAGHGSEPSPLTSAEPSRVYDPAKPSPSTFLVPDGCTIVVHRQPYEWAEEHQYMEAVGRLLLLPKEVLTHPSERSDDILRAIGSVAIYHAGEVCSNFRYTTQSCHPETNRCDGLYGSGVNDLLRMKDVFSSGRNRGTLYKGIAVDRLGLSSDNLRSFDSHDIAAIVAGMYRFSVYPTQDDISAYISKKQGWIHQDRILKEITQKHGSYQGKIIEAVLEGIKRQPEVNPTQQELCHRFPGVYYNLVCRYNEGTDDININNAQLRKPQTRRNTLRYSNRNTVPKNVKNRAVNLLHARLVEAELHRKKHVKQFSKKKVSDAKEALKQLRNRRALIKNYIEHYDPAQQKNNDEGPDLETIKNALTEIDHTINHMKHLNTFVSPSNNTNSTYTRVTNKNGKVTWAPATHHGASRRANRVPRRTRKNTSCH